MNRSWGQTRLNLSASRNHPAWLGCLKSAAICPLLLLLFFAGATAALASSAAKKITVQKLEELVAAIHGKSDAAVADKLIELELTERLSSLRMASLDTAMPGPLARGALIMLDDASAFLRPPADEISTAAPPDPDAQHRLIDLAADYASRTLAKMPNFFATRETMLFMDKPVMHGIITTPVSQSLEFVEKFDATVLYRNGKQVVETRDTKGRDSETLRTGLVTSGEFGPILGTLLTDARQGSITWGYWEQHSGTSLAVFRYSVPKEKSHYKAEFCCVLTGGGPAIFQRLAGYHGEIAIDPQTGTILRLTMQADLKPAYPMARADLMVEYGPIEIGGKTYNCPVKSVAIARDYEPLRVNRNAEPPSGFIGLQNQQSSMERPEILQTMLNHVDFREYHLFRSESRMIIDEEATPADNPPPTVPLSNPNR